MRGQHECIRGLSAVWNPKNRIPKGACIHLACIKNIEASKEDYCTLLTIQSRVTGDRKINIPVLRHASQVNLNCDLDIRHQARNRIDSKSVCCCDNTTYKDKVSRFW